MNDLTHLKHKLGIPEPTPEEIEAEDRKHADARGALIALKHFGGSAAVKYLDRSIAQGRRIDAQAEKDQLYHQVGEANYKPCRKKCKCFKACRCWEKTFDQQKACWEVTRGKITLELRDLWKEKMLPPDT